MCKDLAAAGEHDTRGQASGGVLGMGVLTRNDKMRLCWKVV